MYNEAIILAGGKGKRLRGVVSDRPKPMALINNKPFLEYLLSYLSKNKISHVVLSIGYKAEQVIQYFGNSYKNIKLSYAIEEKRLGTGGGIKFALQKTKNNDVFVINGDTFFNVDLKQLVQIHRNNSADLSMALKIVEDSARYGNILTDKTNRIVSFKEKVKVSDDVFINGGTYLLSKTSFMNLTFPDKFSFEKEYLEKYYTSKKFYGLRFNNYFIDIGLPETYKKAQIDFLNEFGE